MFVYHRFVVCAQIIRTDSSLKMPRRSLLACSPGRGIFLRDSSAGVSLLALIGSNGLNVGMEVCLVKSQIRAGSLCLLLAEGRVRSIVPLGK